MIVPASHESILRGAALIREGKLVAFPTETVYGLGADALSEEACSQIFAVKGRPPTNPLIVHIADIDQARDLISSDCPSESLEMFYKLAALWPGPLTIVMPKSQKVPGLVSAGTETVGIRIPNHPVALSLIREAGVPVAAPSANISNYVSPTNARHVQENLGDLIPMIIDGGSTTVGLESTVISLLSPSTPEILRPGAVTRETIEKVLGRSITERKHCAPREQVSPGMMPVHYAPNTRLVFLSSVDLDTLMGRRIGYIAFSEGQHLTYDFTSIIVLSHNHNLAEVAARLYGALREMDTQDLDLIVIDECIESGVGEAIMDRLKKAVKRYRR